MKSLLLPHTKQRQLWCSCQIGWSARGLWFSERTGGSAAGEPALEQSSRGGARAARAPAEQARRPVGAEPSGGRSVTSRARARAVAAARWTGPAAAAPRSSCCTRRGRARPAGARGRAAAGARGRGRARPAGARGRPAAGARGRGRVAAGAEAGGGRSGPSGGARARVSDERRQEQLRFDFGPNRIGLFPSVKIGLTCGSYGWVPPVRA